MRMIILAAAAGATLVLAGPVNAQAPSTNPAQTPPPASAPQSPAQVPAIKTVSVVDLDELPEATKGQLNQLLATRTADQLERLRQAIDTAPVAKSALEAKGLSSRDVVIAQIDDEGELTIITKKAG
ncbi:hypothetical protein [Bosea vaviloviae]|nr:hypothetical protein [Bosea vaviloviae]